MSVAADENSIRVRPGTRSCAECRRRKIRCIWPRNRNGSRLDERSACDRCVARGLPCLPQLARSAPQSRPSVQGTTDDRLGRIERELASLTALVRERNSILSPDQSQADVDNVVVEDEPSYGDIANTNSAYHLRLLFDDFDIYSMENESSEIDLQSNRSLKAAISMARVKMQRLLPLREEIERVAGFASDWMALYHTLFPAFFTFRTGENLVSNFDRMSDPEVPPVVLAMFLLSVAITAQQLGPESETPSIFRGLNATRFVDVVCQVIGQTVIDNDALVATVQGIEMAMLFIRLQLGRGNLKRTWMMLRRVIALAEMISLPRAHYDVERHSKHGNKQRDTADPESLKLKAAVWEAVCATDRNFSMMMNLPAGTSRYDFPNDQSIWKEDHVSAQAYNYQLSAICAIVFEIDELYVRGVHEAEAYEKVLVADRKLRSLMASAPQAWWQVQQGEPLADLLVKFWHCYITVRVHLRPAVMSNLDSQYAYSRSTCLEACQNAVRRFINFRPSTPSGFFVCRVLDVQAFTAATFLLLSSRSDPSTQSSSRPNVAIEPQAVQLIDELVQCFRLISDRPGSDFAREAINALKTLESNIQGDNSGQASSLTLQIPLLGRIRINLPGSRLRYQMSTQNINRDLGFSSRNLNSLGMPEVYSSEEARPEVRPSSSLSAPFISLQPTPPMSWNIEFDTTPFWADSSSAIEMGNSIDNQGYIETLRSWF